MILAEQPHFLLLFICFPLFLIKVCCSSDQCLDFSEKYSITSRYKICCLPLETIVSCLTPVFHRTTDFADWTTHCYLFLKSLIFFQIFTFHEENIAFWTRMCSVPDVFACLRNKSYYRDFELHSLSSEILFLTQLKVSQLKDPYVVTILNVIARCETWRGHIVLFFLICSSINEMYIILDHILRITAPVIPIIIPMINYT